MTYLVTGGAGFIGSAVVRQLIAKAERVVVLDALTYAGNISSLKPVEDSPNLTFIQGNICDTPLVARLLASQGITRILHLAAESHVDRSIERPGDFVQTNLVGTESMLTAALEYYRGLSGAAALAFRFHHISTDEVFGDLGPNDPPFEETTPYAPHSPYSASKAGSDFLVDAWHHTYGLPVVISNCSNNYGAFQFPEKLIPRTLLRALEGREIPIYGRGENVRDWLHVEDHARALVQLVTQGRVGGRYVVGGDAERSNNQVAAAICQALDRLRPRADGRSYAEHITYVTDRAGHDRRYAINFSKIREEFGWQPTMDFETGINATVRWYLDNAWWWQPLWTQDRK